MNIGQSLTRKEWIVKLLKERPLIHGKLRDVWRKRFLESWHADTSVYTAARNADLRVKDRIAADAIQKRRDEILKYKRQNPALPGLGESLQETIMNTLLFEKAKSKKQARFFRVVRAVQTGDIPKSNVTPNLAKTASTVSPVEVDKFAKTKESGLPEKVKKEVYENLRRFRTLNEQLGG